MDSIQLIRRAATIGALLVAKVVRVADKFPWINRFPNKPLMYSVVWKTLMYITCTFVVRFFEHLLPLLFEGKSVGYASSNFQEKWFGHISGQFRCGF